VVLTPHSLESGQLSGHPSTRRAVLRASHPQGSTTASVLTHVGTGHVWRGQSAGRVVRVMVGQKSPGGGGAGVVGGGLRLVTMVVTTGLEGVLLGGGGGGGDGCVVGRRVVVVEGGLTVGKAGQPGQVQRELEGWAGGGGGAWVAQASWRVLYSTPQPP